MLIQNHKAFTMLELVFVIVVIGILSAVAIPKFAMNRDDAVIAKAKTVVASVRNVIATERQKRLLRGNFSPIFRLTDSSTLGDPIFNAIDGNTSNTVLQYPPFSCKAGTSTGCWKETKVGTATTNAQYTYMMPVSGSVVFTLQNNQFNCPATTGTDTAKRDCRLLTQ
jgi:general secretion pathway protein G